jgi:hypothetical protein
MNKSESIAKISAALVKSQSEMSNAKKESNNPFFKSKYADLNAIREAALPVLNKHGITVIQPTCVVDGINYVETILLHESGEYISSLTQIVVDKVNDAQKHGSGLSYARRYALQSIVCLGAEDDDANAASQPTKNIDAEREQAIRNFNVCKSKDDVEKVWKGLPAYLRALPEVVEACKIKGESFKTTKP